MKSKKFPLQAVPGPTGNRIHVTLSTLMQSSRTHTVGIGGGTRPEIPSQWSNRWNSRLKIPTRTPTGIPVKRLTGILVVTPKRIYNGSTGGNHGESPTGTPSATSAGIRGRAPEIIHCATSIGLSADSIEEFLCDLLKEFSVKLLDKLPVKFL